MAITYTAARALLASQATTLSAQATIVGLTSLATALTNLSTEITSATISEDEFFGNGSTSYTSTGGTGGATPTGGTSSGSGTSKGSAAQVYAQTRDRSEAARRHGPPGGRARLPTLIRACPRDRPTRLACPARACAQTSTR